MNSEIFTKKESLGQKCLGTTGLFRSQVLPHSFLTTSTNTADLDSTLTTHRSLALNTQFDCFVFIAVHFHCTLPSLLLRLLCSCWRGQWHSHSCLVHLHVVAVQFLTQVKKGVTPSNFCFCADSDPDSESESYSPNQDTSLSLDVSSLSDSPSYVMQHCQSLTDSHRAFLPINFLPTN